MKRILIVCDQTNIDIPLRRSLAHLVKSCRITVVANGYQAFKELENQTFELIIIDSEITGIDSLELAESMEYTDPVSPIILMLKNSLKPLWGSARRIKANPILRPFKPLTFLRLVDTLLHQQLERYRYLLDTLKTELQQLQNAVLATDVLLVDNSGQILVSFDQIEPPHLKKLGQLTVATANENTTLQRQTPLEEALLVTEPTEKDYDLHTIPVFENLYLALLLPAITTQVDPLQLQDQLNLTVHHVRQIFHDYNIDDELYTPQVLAYQLSAEVAEKYTSIPLKLGIIQPQPTAPPLTQADDTNSDNDNVNWKIIGDSSSVLNRLHDFCQIG